MEFQARNTFLDLPNYFQLELHLWELDVSFQFQQLPGLRQEYTYKHIWYEYEINHKKYWYTFPDLPE